MESSRIAASPGYMFSRGNSVELEVRRRRRRYDRGYSATSNVPHPNKMIAAMRAGTLKNRGSAPKTENDGDGGGINEDRSTTTHVIAKSATGVTNAAAIQKTIRRLRVSNV